MRVLALFPSHMDPESVAGFVASQLGDGFEVRGAPSPDASQEWLRTAEVILAALVRVGAEHIDRATELRFIQCPSHGFDHVDIGAAAGRGIPVANVGTSGAEAGTVAEHAMLLLLACAKRLVEGHERTRTGEWPNTALLRAGLNELQNRTLGIVGLGHIGRETARRALAFGMRVQYADPVPDREAERELGLSRVPLDDLLKTSDAITIHTPLLPATRGLIGERELGLLRDGAIVVNTSRGPIVDQTALARECSEGRLRAGVDVFDPEPPPADHPLLHADNVTLSPHTGGVTRESVVRIMAEAIANVKRFASGEHPRDVVNGA